MFVAIVIALVLGVSECLSQLMQSIFFAGKGEKRVGPGRRLWSTSVVVVATCVLSGMLATFFPATGGLAMPLVVLASIGSAIVNALPDRILLPAPDAQSNTVAATEPEAPAEVVRRFLLCAAIRKLSLAVTVALFIGLMVGYGVVTGEL